MPLLETVATSLGGAVARSVLKVWLKDDTLAQTLGLSVSDIAESKARGFLERRSIERNFDRLAEQVARKLAPYLEAEFRDVPDSEIESAVIAVQETIDAASLSAEILLGSDLEPIRLEATFREAFPDAPGRKFLSLDGQQIYDFTLRQSVNYIVEVVATLPAFQDRATIELLERETKLIELVEEVLRRLPDDSATGGIDDPIGFEAQYRREVARKLDALELFGVTTDPINKRYALSVAYIGLTASVASAPVKDEKDQLTASESPDSDERLELSVEELIARGSRALIRGEAGSGKTTLLQWLAVSSARRRFENELEDWNDLVPFFVRLREYVGNALPMPSDFPTEISPALSDRQPEDWVARLMEEGRALVLIDGVDELREDERPAAATWLSDLVAIYPDAHYVITSRPPAVSEDWLDPDGFSAAFLEPMDLTSIDHFIEHWHEAVKGAAGSDEEEELDGLARRLKTLVREVPQIRNLATSPLLCAMLCALNRDRKAQLPRARVELYRIGLEMLLERRDVAREIVPDGLDLSRPQKERLLQSVAFWLLTNGASDVTSDDAENILEPRLTSIPDLEATPEVVLSHLLLRSGLLREPVKGRIDFIHRTFAEYLSAKQALDERSIGLLIEHAHEDQWQEVIVLAAGQATEEMSQMLMRRLLDRGSEEPRHSHRLGLLAVACLESSQTLPQDLREEIDRVLEGLIPPRTMTEARAIASAGNLAVARLGKYADKPVAVAAPCARALGLIGGPGALTALERFGKDSRVTVTRELIRAWDYFPQEEFAERVLSHSGLIHGGLSVGSSARMSGLGHLEKLVSLDCWIPGSRTPDDWDWAVLGKIDSLRSLTIRWATDLAGIPQLPLDGRSLRHLQLSGCDALKEANLENFEHLVTLRLTLNDQLERLRALSKLPRLETLHLANNPNLRVDEQLPTSLTALIFTNPNWQDLSLLATCNRLESIAINRGEDLVDVEALAELETLETLTISESPRLRSLGSGYEKLKGLALDRLEAFRFDEVPNLLQLRGLTIRQPDLRSVDFIGEMPNLTSLTLSGCSRLSDLEAVGRCHRIKHLTMIGCLEVPSLDPLGDLVDLERLDIELCQGIKSLEPLDAPPALEWVDIRGCSHALDPKPLTDRGVHVALGPATGYGRTFLPTGDDIPF